MTTEAKKRINQKREINGVEWVNEINEGGEERKREREKVFRKQSRTNKQEKVTTASLSPIQWVTNDRNAALLHRAERSHFREMTGGQGGHLKTTLNNVYQTKWIHVRSAGRKSLFLILQILSHRANDVSVYLLPVQVWVWPCEAFIIYHGFLKRFMNDVSTGTSGVRIKTNRQH